MKCIIVDDDELSRLALKKCIERTKDLELVGEFSSAIEASNNIADNTCDLIFLDVEMPKMSGIDFIRQIKNIPQVIIVSGKKKYATDAFDYNVTDYILKPVEYDRFLVAIDRAKSIDENLKIDQKQVDFLFIKVDSKLINLPLTEILYIEAYSDYVLIHTSDKRHIVLATMKAVESKLPEASFIRIHRSYIVRIDKINEIEGTTLYVGDKALPISRSYKENFFNRINSL